MFEYAIAAGGLLITMDIHIAEEEFLVKLKKTMVNMMMILKFLGFGCMFFIEKMFLMNSMVLMKIFIVMEEIDLCKLVQKGYRKNLFIIVQFII